MVLPKMEGDLNPNRVTDFSSLYWYKFYRAFDSGVHLSRTLKLVLENRE
jgi:hypothetical protein